jgi:hypothetical protein
VNNMLMQNYLCDSSHIIREGIVANVWTYCIILSQSYTILYYE